MHRIKHSITCLLFGVVSLQIGLFYSCTVTMKDIGETSRTEPQKDTCMLPEISSITVCCYLLCQRKWDLHSNASLVIPCGSQTSRICKYDYAAVMNYEIFPWGERNSFWSTDALWRHTCRTGPTLTKVMRDDTKPFPHGDLWSGRSRNIHRKHYCEMFWWYQYVKQDFKIAF